MTITALIVDDEQLAREELKYLLDTTRTSRSSPREPMASRRSSLSATTSPTSSSSTCRCPASTALPCSRTDRDDRTALPQIIFATAFDQYAVRAFDVNAIDYLLKPFDQARVMQALERARLRLQETYAELKANRSVCRRTARSSSMR